MNAEERQTTGQRLRRIRQARHKSQEVVAGLAGISPSYLCRLEKGERALDRHALITALAAALEITPSELLGKPVAVPREERTDTAVRAVRAALLSVAHQLPDGEVLPVAALRSRVTATITAHCQCDQDDKVGAALPGLIRDLHTSIAAGRNVAELLDLAVLLHTEATTGWLGVAGAPLDLRSQAALLAREVGRERDTPTALGLAAWGGLYVLVTAGEFDLAQAELDSVPVSTASPESRQLAGVLALCRSLVAATVNRPGDADAALDHAAELAERTGEGNAYWMGFGPTNVGCWRMHTALEIGDHHRAVAIAETLRPRALRVPKYQAYYWANYGRALAQVRSRRDDAALAMRRAERISPRHFYRDPAARETLAELVTRSRPDDAVGREVRRMAYRAGLPV